MCVRVCACVLLDQTMRDQRDQHTVVGPVSHLQEASTLVGKATPLPLVSSQHLTFRGILPVAMEVLSSAPICLALPQSVWLTTAHLAQDFQCWLICPCAPGMPTKSCCRSLWLFSLELPGKEALGGMRAEQKMPLMVANSCLH